MRSCAAPSRLQRIEVPSAASPGRSFTNEPPSSVPAPVIVPRIGIPAPASTRVACGSSPRRMRTAIRPTIAPPGTDSEGSRVYMAFT